MNKTGCLILVLLLGVIGARADEPVKLSASAMFREAYRIQTRADEARDLYRNGDAVTLYRAARDAFLRLTQEYPDWLPGDARYRISYCDEQLRIMDSRMGARSRAVLPLTGSEALPSRHAAPARPTVRPEIRPAPAPVPAPAPARAATGGSAVEGTLTSVRHYLKQGEHELARAALLKAMRKDPDNPSVRLLMSMAQCQAGRYRDSIHVAKQLIDEDPGNAYAHMVLSTAYFGLGYLAESAAELRKTLDLDPRMPDPHYNLAQILLIMEPIDRNAAGYHYREALKLGMMRDPATELALDTGRFPSRAGTADYGRPPLGPRAVPAAPGTPADKPWYRRIWSPWKRDRDE